MRLTAFVMAFVAVSVMCVRHSCGGCLLTLMFVLRVYSTLPISEMKAAFWSIIIPVSIAYGTVASG